MNSDLVFCFLLRRVFSLALTVCCCEDKDVKLFCKFLRAHKMCTQCAEMCAHIPGLQVLPSFTRHDNLSIKLASPQHKYTLQYEGSPSTFDLLQWFFFHVLYTLIKLKMVNFSLTFLAQTCRVNQQM